MHSSKDYKVFTCGAFLIVCARLASADSIRVEGEWFEDVYISETSSMYYVRVPSDGSVISVRISDVDPQDVRISENRGEREALNRRWRENRAGIDARRTSENRIQDFPFAADISDWLEPLLEKHHFPALAAGVILDGQLVAQGATGLRKVGDDARVTVNDAFHLGSCTKAITATLVGMLIEEGKLQWDTTILDVFTDLVDTIHPQYRGVTVRHLLAHQSGIPKHSWPEGMGFRKVHDIPGSPREQRAAYLRLILAEEPEAPPGTKMIYSNTGYAAAGAMAEEVTDTDWETLIRQRIFTPLRMHTAGFDDMASPGQVDGPWQHRLGTGTAQPIAPGRYTDNPAALAPAGKIHASIGDWSKFILAHLEGARQNNMLRRETYQALYTPAFGGNYAGGWLLVDRPWGGGRVLTHAGSNNQNYCVVWMAPKKNFAALVATNVGGAGSGVDKACDQVVWALVQKYLLKE